jgi:hypothetical protein
MLVHFTLNPSKGHLVAFEIPTTALAAGCRLGVTLLLHDPYIHVCADLVVFICWREAAESDRRFFECYACLYGMKHCSIM